MPEAAEWRPLRQVAIGVRLPLGPFFAVPIAAAFVLAEHILVLRARAPVVLVNDDLGIKWIAIGFVGVPAHIAAADDRRRRAHGGSRQQAGAERGAREGLAE